MTIVFQDPFTGSLNTTNWAQSGGGTDFSTDGELTCGVSGNRSLATTTAAHAALRDVKITFTRASAGGFDAGVYVRGNFGGTTSNTGTGYIFNPFSSQVDWICRKAGANRTVGSWTGVTQGDGTVFDIVVTDDGSTVTAELFVDGVSKGTKQDVHADRILTTGRTGYYVFSSGSRIDNFIVDDLVVVADPPSITDVDEDNVVTSTQTNVEIDGTDFDTATVEIRQGSTTVAQSIDSQSATAIQFDVVFESTMDLKYGAATLAVINDDDQEDTIAITIDPPSGVAYVDITTPDATAANRITAVDDLASGDQLEIFDVQGGTIADVTVYPDATFDCDEVVTAFYVRAWDASDSMWGASQPQSFATGQTIEVGLNTETDSAFALTWSKAKAVGLCEEADSAFSVAKLKTLVVGLATEIDSALTLQSQAVAAVAQAIRRGATYLRLMFRRG